MAVDDGSCTLCDNPVIGVGPNCQYTNKKQCNDVGTVQYNGTCTCPGPELGIGPTCEFSNNKTCSGAGAANYDGSCICNGPETGIGPTCKELSNAKDCNTVGEVQIEYYCISQFGAALEPGEAGNIGNTVADKSVAPSLSFGSGSGSGMLSLLSNLFGYGDDNANEADTVTGSYSDDGDVVFSVTTSPGPYTLPPDNCTNPLFTHSCVCDDPALGIGPACQYNNQKTCNGVGIAQYNGTCICAGSRSGLGPTCSEYSDSKTCFNLGTVNMANIMQNPNNTEALRGTLPWCDWDEGVKHLIVGDPADAESGSIQCHDLVPGNCKESKYRTCTDICKSSIDELVLEKRQDDYGWRARRSASKADESAPTTQGGMSDFPPPPHRSSREVLQ